MAHSLLTRQTSRVRSAWSALDESVTGLALSATGDAAASLADWRPASRAMLFHLGRAEADGPLHIVLLGGTGAGKSTMMNRLLDASLSATSHLRTYTRGPVAAVATSASLDPEWSGLAHRETEAGDERRGEEGVLQIVRTDAPLLNSIHLIDSTDVDGDCAAHHDLARRMSHWAEALLVVTTPEKYQMTETIPFIDAARLCRVPVWFVMNKCEEGEVLEDFTAQLLGRGWRDPAVFAVPREGSDYAPPEGQDFEDLRAALATPRRPPAETILAGLRARGSDLLTRLRESVLDPIARARAEIGEVTLALESILAPEPGVDVSPITRRLEQRLHQRSVLYLVGPDRVMDRLRKLPSALSRMPRGAWDLLARGTKSDGATPTDSRPDEENGSPDYGAVVTDQFMIIQSRIEDILHSRPGAAQWVERDRKGFERTRIDPAEAAAAADRELQDLRKWLAERWDSTPRDTRVLQKMLAALPGGKKLTEWSEAAPWALALILSVHGAFLGPVDLLILGGFGLASWAGEKLSNEVAARARETNRAISRDFHVLVRRQVDQVILWLDRQAPSAETLREAGELADRAGRELARTGGKKKA